MTIAGEKSRFRTCSSKVAQFMLDYDLQFEPGERVSYSNFGYLLLGQVAEVLTKKDYYGALTEHLLKPSGIKDIKLAKRRLMDRYVNEPAYSARDTFDIEMMGAHGGLVGNAEALCQFLSKFWLNGKPRKPSDEPQDIARYGSLPRTTAVARQYKGWDVVILCNGRREGEPKRGDYVWHNDYMDLIKKVNAEIERLPIPEESKE
jgi:CubicO group peptidase (beta-lactamase class C family)